MGYLVHFHTQVPVKLYRHHEDRSEYLLTIYVDDSIAKMPEEAKAISQSYASFSHEKSLITSEEFELDTCDKCGKFIANSNIDLIIALDESKCRGHFSQRLKKNTIPLAIMILILSLTLVAIFL